MRLLILGDANSPFIIHFTKWIKRKRTNYSIDILNTSKKCDLPNTYDKVTQVFPKDHFENTSFFIKFKSLYLMRKSVKSINKKEYDTIILHYIYPWYAPMSKLLRSKTTKLVAVFWGSDLNRISKFKMSKLHKLFKKTDAIILGSPFLFEKINNKIPSYKSKYNMCYFGCEPIEELKILKDTNYRKQKAKDQFNIPHDKITIALGYNGGKSQQHIKMIRNLGLSKELLKNKEQIHIILPLTYGLNKAYKIEIENELKKINYSYTILTSFMNEKESAMLRIASDIFVNLQLTDSFNGTLRESFYAGSIIINGSWLPYKTLKEYGLYYHEIKTIDNLNNKLIYCINNFKKEVNKSLVNKNLIYDITSWSKTITTWLNVIEK